MEPAFTLPWPEFHLAARLQKAFPKNAVYSVMAPMAREERVVDLAGLKRTKSGSNAATFQVKASRTWVSKEGRKVRPRTVRSIFQYTRSEERRVEKECR